LEARVGRLRQGFGAIWISIYLVMSIRAPQPPRRRVEARVGFEPAPAIEDA